MTTCRGIFFFYLCVLVQETNSKIAITRHSVIKELVSCRPTVNATLLFFSMSEFNTRFNELKFILSSQLLTQPLSCMNFWLDYL